MSLTDQLHGSDIAPGQVWRHDTCPPDERAFTYEVVELRDERVFLRPLDGGTVAETTVGSLLAYWVPIQLA